MREAGGLNLLELSLRLFVIPLSVVSICFMVLDKEANNDYGSIRYSDISGLKLDHRKKKNHVERGEGEVN
ncbi:hypothetical protein QJS10_CPA01g00871 [Acorus calamus]|uniref:Uncharacterized protein n=1 Tax=Acorus calamus TaxID=4465 RepID=A0AAV9FLB8_ACOCL|nr:hypothetical protein QJS10_CPA01g00871 [Acorus calamus]